MTRMKTYLAKIFGWMRLHTMALAVLLLLAAILPPVQVQGQISPCCAVLSAGLGTINTTLGSVIGGGLSSIKGVLTTIQQFEQQVVSPAQAIGQSRGLGGAIQAIYKQIRNLVH